MVPSLMIAAAAFACFLIVLLAIGYSAFRLTARRETPIGAAGGCALAAVLLGATFFAFVGLAIFFAFFFAHEHRGEIREQLLQHRHDSRSLEIDFDDEEPGSKPPFDESRDPAKPKGDVRQY